MKKNKNIFKKTIIAIIAAFSFILVAPNVSYADNNDAIQLQWDEQETYTSDTSESFIKIQTIVPGDSDKRTLHIKNNGPTDGNLKISIVNVQTNDRKNDSFYNDLKITTKFAHEKNYSLQELVNNKTTVIDTQKIKKDQVQDVTIGYNFDINATSGNSSNEQKTATFDVYIELIGENTDNSTPSPTTPAPVTPVPTNNPTTNPTPNTPNNNTSNNNANKPEKTANNNHSIDNKNTDNAKNVTHGSSVKTGGEILTKKYNNVFGILLIAGGALIFSIIFMFIKRHKIKN